MGLAKSIRGKLTFYSVTQIFFTADFISVNAVSIVHTIQVLTATQGRGLWYQQRCGFIPSENNVYKIFISEIYGKKINGVEKKIRKGDWKKVRENNLDHGFTNWAISATSGRFNCWVGDEKMSKWTENGGRLEILVGFWVLKINFNICYPKRNIPK